MGQRYKRTINELVRELGAEKLRVFINPDHNFLTSHSTMRYQLILPRQPLIRYARCGIICLRWMNPPRARA